MTADTTWKVWTVATLVVTAFVCWWIVQHVAIRPTDFTIP